MRILTLDLPLYNEDINTFYHLQETCLWIASAGVEGYSGEFPDKSVFENIFTDFYIPEMKLPLR